MLCNYSLPQCNQCNFVLSTERYIRKHMMKMHRAEPPWPIVWKANIWCSAICGLGAISVILEQQQSGIWGTTWRECIRAAAPWPIVLKSDLLFLVQQSGTAEWYSRVVEQQQESRLGEMGIGGLVGWWRMHRREQCNLTQSSSSARVRRFSVHWLCALMTRGGELCVMQCLSDSSAMMISGSPGLLMDDVWDSSRFHKSNPPNQALQQVYLCITKSRMMEMFNDKVSDSSRFQKFTGPTLTLLS